jgi:hypothetical protein
METSLDDLYRPVLSIDIFVETEGHIVAHDGLNLRRWVLVLVLLELGRCSSGFTDLSNITC